jgi:serine-type D-Ala-D-Ala carboxypeptidase (penicillin-binding protein 5/6)
MARLAMGYPEFREMVATQYATITTQDREIPLTSTNNLLFVYPPTTGVKTGTTPGSGPSLVASATSGNESYVSVILDAKEDRFAASIQEVEHGFAAYDRVNLAAEGKQYAKADVPYRRGETVDLVAKENVDGLVDGKSRSSAGSECSRICPPPRGRARSSARSWSGWTGSASGRARSSPAKNTRRPRCGSGCGIQRPAFGRSQVTSHRP